MDYVLLVGKIVHIEDMSTPKSSELTTLPQGIYTFSLSHQFCFKSWFFLLHRLVAGFRAIPKNIYL